MSFSDPKYMNPIRTRYGLKNYGYFIFILIIDPNRPESEKNRHGSEPKNLNYLLGPNV